MIFQHLNKILITFFSYCFQTRLLPLSVSSMTASVHRQPSFYQPRSIALPSSQTMVLNNANGARLKRDTLSCDDIVDHCNNNSDSNDNSSLHRNNQAPCNNIAYNNPYAKVSLEKINTRNNLGFVVATPPHLHYNPRHNTSQSYHPHSIFYGQQYHRIQPQSFHIPPHSGNPVIPAPPVYNSGVPIRLTDSFEHLNVQRHSGSSFRSSNTQSPPSVSMEDSALCSNLVENPYECIPAHFKEFKESITPTSEAEAVTRFDSN